MIEIMYEVDKESSEYKKFLPKYLTTKNKWDLFLKNVSNEFIHCEFKIPLLDIKEKIPDIENNIDIILSNILLIYRSELSLDTKILFGLELVSKLDSNDNKGITTYTYKIRNYKNNPKVAKYLPILNDVDYLPTVMLYNFIGNCSLLVSNSVGRISVVTPTVSLDKDNIMRLVFKYKSDGNVDEFVIKEPKLPNYISFIKEVIYDE